MGDYGCAGLQGVTDGVASSNAMVHITVENTVRRRRNLASFFQLEGRDGWTVPDITVGLVAVVHKGRGGCFKRPSRFNGYLERWIGSPTHQHNPQESRLVLVIFFVIPLVFVTVQIQER